MKISKLSKRIICLLLSVMMVLLLAGCTSFDNFRRTFLEKNSEDSNVIYIGVFEPETGSSRETGQQEIKGIELANSEYSTVKGMRVELVKMDTESDTNSAVSNIKNLIKMNPVAIIGSSEEANSMIAAEEAKKSKIPMITPSASNPLITENNSYAFRACITYDQRGDGLAEYALRELNSKKIATIILKNDSTLQTMKSAFQKRIKKAKVNKASIVLDESIETNNFDAKKLVKQIRKSGADTVFAPIGLEKANLLFQEIEKQGMTNITFLGNQDWTSADLLALIKKHPSIKLAFTSDNVLNGNDTSDAITAETQRFLIKYSNKYGDDDIPTQHTVLGYDAYMLIINAINNAESLDPKDIRDALANTKDLRCATGTFNFDSDGNPIRQVNISTVKNGKIVSAYVTETTSTTEGMKKVEQ